LEKIFFPKAGFTKGDMVKYYVDVAPYILPHLRNRPVSLVRFPDGITGERFYEKNVPRFAPAWIKTVAVPRKSEPGTTRYIIVNDASTLAWCANLAALEFHAFLHRAASLQRPTSVVFDLDPGAGANLLTCARVALHLKAILDPLGLTALPKVSGSKGLQLYVPLNTPVTYAATSIFAKAVAELLKQQFPALVVSEMSKDLRRGKVFIDWSQNGSSKTTVAVYSLRGKRDEPYVSMPVTWRELSDALKRRSEKSLFFSPADALRRLAKRGDLFAPVLSLKQSLPRRFMTELEAIAAPALYDRGGAGPAGLQGKTGFHRHPGAAAAAQAGQPFIGPAVCHSKTCRLAPSL
jgi:bifunctional non-homologous end joining protein LigD